LLRVGKVSTLRMRGRRRGKRVEGRQTEGGRSNGHNQNDWSRGPEKRLGEATKKRGNLQTE